MDTVATMDAILPCTFRPGIRGHAPRSRHRFHWSVHARPQRTPPRHDTRSRLLDAVEGLIADHGFKPLTHRTIASRAEAHVALLNYHFGSKEQLIEEALAQNGGQMAATARALGLERSHLYKKAKALGLRGEASEEE